MIAKFKIFNTLSRNDDNIFEIHKSHDFFTIERLVPDTSADSNIKLMLTNKPLEIIKHNTQVSYCNNAIVHLKEGDSVSLYPMPEGFLSVELKNEPVFTVKSIALDKVTLEISNRKNKMTISNGGTELGTLVLDELEDDIAELVINAGVGYYSMTDNGERMSQNIILTEVIKEASDNV